MEFSGRGFKSPSGQLSTATSNNPSVVNTIYIYIFIHIVMFLMVGETYSMVGYHLMTEDHSLQLQVWGVLGAPQQLQGSTLVGVRIFQKNF